MTTTDLPIPEPIWLDPSVIDGNLHRDCQEKLIVIINLLYSNCIRVRAAIVLLQQVNRLLPPIELAIKDDLSYANKVIENMKLEEPWRRMAARDAAFGVDNFRFILDLLAKRPAEFGFNAEGRTAVGIARISEAFGQEFPKIKEVRDAAAHSDQILRQPKRNAIDSSISTLNAITHGGGKILISDGMAGDNYIVTKEGRYLEFFVTPQTYKKLYSTYCSVAVELT